MSNQLLNKHLQKLDFDTESSDSSLLFTDRDYSGNFDVSFDEILVLHQAEELGASGVYFRRVEGRSSIPQLFIFDDSDNCLELSDIHIKLWSSGIVPLYYVFDNTEIRIFDCREPVAKKTRKAKEFDTFSLVSEVHAKYKKYSASLFANGSFWELEENRERFKASSSSHKQLIDGLKRIRKEFAADKNKEVYNKLIVLSILVKYLEEKKDSHGKCALPEEYFNKFGNAGSFCDVLRQNKCHILFEHLSKEVNGKIFELSESEINSIKEIDQSRLAEFLDANTVGNQPVFWKLYDFNYLPVDLISRIYEEFIPNRKDIAYTPTHLVDFMIDECMPMSSSELSYTNYKIIDVSCGSGVFLVGAFKRMVQWWQREQYLKTGEVRTPNIRKLKSILAKSIHGVDIESEAVRLAKFSLTVAVCDMLDPTKMWEELTQNKLVDLSSNIVTKDFFDFIKTIKTNNKYDLVIGNPPFNLPVEGKDEKKNYWESLTKKVSLDFKVPRNNIALLFLQQAMKLLKKDGLLSFVMPSGPLLFNDTLDFRKNFLETYNVPQIFDFSCLRAVLFDNKNVSASVIFAQNSHPDSNDILYVPVKRTVTSKEKLFFEIDKYDLHYVPKEQARNEQLIWKVNLLGGGHLYAFVKRMQSLDTLEKYLKIKKKDHKWFYGVGYEVLQESTDKPLKAPHLSGKLVLPSENFISDEINEYDLQIETAKLFHRTKENDKLIFKKPHVLIKTNIELPILFSDQDLIFRKDITGIHAPDTNIARGELAKIVDIIKTCRQTYKAIILLSSGRIGIGRETSVRSKDILRLPYSENKNELKLSNAEKIAIEDVLRYGFEQLAKGECARVNTTKTDSRTLAAFSKVFCKSLNSIYEEGIKQFYSLDYIESSSYICYPFAYGNPDRPKKISKTKTARIAEGDLSNIIDNEQGTNVLYKRIIKLYNEKDMVYLVKPKLLKYWLKSIALRDASDVFTDLVSSGY